EVAPALGQSALALERRTPAVAVHQIHRAARAVGGVHRGQPAAGPLLESGLAPGRDGVPELGDHRAAVDAAGVQDRVGPPDRVLDLRVLAEQTGPPARDLPAGQLDQRVDAGPGDPGDHRRVVGPDPRLARQGVGDPGPPAPLVVQRDAGVDHRAPLRQEDVLDRPVEAARPAQSGPVPAPVDDLRLGAGEDPAPVRRVAVRAAARLIAVEDLKAAEHPRALLTPAAEAPAAGDPVAAVHRHRAPASLHGGAGADGVGPVRLDLADALLGRAQGDELADAVVGQVPAGRAGALGQYLDDAQVGQRVGLQAAELARDHQ